MFQSWTLDKFNRGQKNIHLKASKGVQDTEYIAVPDIACILSGLVAQYPRVEQNSSK